MLTSLQRIVHDELVGRLLKITGLLEKAWKESKHVKSQILDIFWALVVGIPPCANFGQSL